MDPATAAITIAGAAATAVEVIHKLKGFISDVRNVDETVQKLCAELESLQIVLESINNSFVKLKPMLSENDDLRRVWECVERTGGDCLQAIGKLDGIFRKLEKGTTNAYQAVVKQLKLQSGSNEIAELRRQLSFYHTSFQTSLTSIILCMVSQDEQPNHNVLDVVVSKLDDRLDKLSQSLNDLKKNLHHRITHSSSNKIDENSEERLISHLTECKKSARAIYSSACSVISKLSTAASDSTSPLTVEQKDRIFEWAQRTSLTDQAITEPSLDAISTIYGGSSLESTITGLSSVDGTQRGGFEPSTSTVFGENLEVRTILTDRGKAHYFEGSYSRAVSCFKEASKLGTIGAPDPDLPNTIMTDESLKLWLSLTKLRAWNRRRRSRPLDRSRLYFGSPNLEVARLNSETASVRDCVDACILAQIYIHLNELSTAEAICEAALTSLARLEHPASVPYQDAVLTKVEMLYSKRLTEYTKAWRTRVSTEALNNKVAQLLVVLENREKLLRYDEQDYRGGFRKAVRVGNFPIALYILSRAPAESLKMEISWPTEVRPVGWDGREQVGAEEPNTDDDENIASTETEEDVPQTVFGQEEHYLADAMKSDSLAMINLLMEHWSDINSKPSTNTQVITSSLQLPTSTSRSRKAIFLFAAIKHNNQRAVEFLLSLGADKDHPHTSASEQTAITCYNTFYECYSSPLGYAVSQGRREICQLLLSKGAAINGKGGNIEPPLNIAIRCPRGRPLIALLLEAGADVNYAFKNVRPLALAIHQRENEMVQCLLRSGAEMQESFVGGTPGSGWRGSKWMTPVQQAKAKSLYDVERTLKQWKREGKTGFFDRLLGL